MLHELLVALRGHPGLIFIEKNGSLSVNKTISELHPCEVVIINQLLEVASDYRSLCQYIERNRYSFETAMYVSALYEGLDIALEPYRQTIVDLEVDILKHAGTQLSLLQHRLLPHRPVLRALVQLVREVEEEQPVGCMILDKVYKASASGVEGVGRALKQVLSELHKVLYKQLLAWLLQGNLYDPFNEFFIVKDDQAEDSLLLTTGEEGGEASRSKSKTFKLRLELVPHHLSHSLAHKIFFIGESIQLFESDRRVEVQGAVLKDREAEFYHELSRLRDKEVFEVGEFSAFVDNIRETVSCHLHNLMMKEADFISELERVWSLFLLGRGELFHTFIRLMDDRLRGFPTITTQNDINQAWRSSLQLVLSHAEEEIVSQKAKVVVGSERAESWSQLSIQYAVPWPLHLIITPSAISRYNKIFSLLLLIRRTQNGLNQLWSEMMMKDRCGRRELIKDDIWETRQHISFLISNIQSYVLSDVLETQRAKLMKNLSETKSFETAKEAHEQFLTDVSAHLFLLNPTVLKILKDLLALTLKFTQGVTDNPQGAGHLCEKLNLSAALLLQLLTKMRQKLQGSHLAQLLLRLDYNRFFSLTKKITTPSTNDDNV